MGMTLREIIFDIGGGIPDGSEIQGSADWRAFGRLYSGGVSWICRSDYETLTSAGLHHGFGRHDRDGRYVLHGRRRPVLHGVLHDGIVRQMHSLPRGHGADVRAAGTFHEQRGDAARSGPAEELCDVVRNTSLCGLGQSAPNPVLSTLRYFRTGI